jgi:hypothetical protein
MYKPFPNTYWGVGYSNDRNTAFAKIKKDMDLPSIGDRWNNPDLYQADISEETVNQLPIGAYLVGPINYNTRSATPDPYILDFEIDGDKIPTNEPFVISFGVSDPNSVASEDDVLSSTVQCMRTGEDEFVYPVTKEHAGKEFVSNGHQIKIQEWVNAEKIDHYNYDVEWMDTSDVYKTIKENDTGSTREWTVTRATNLGRYSPKLDPHNEEYNVFDSHYMAYGTRPPHYLDTPYQNLWSIDYTITREQIQELDDVEKSGNQVTQWSQNTTVQEHPVIQDIAEQLRNVCDRIDATNNIERVRVVADFVQYFTHRLEGTGVGATRTLPSSFSVRDNMNPLKTLYEAEGDCVSFTILANTILRTDYFDMNPDVAHIEDGGIFTAGGREVGHISTGIPYDEIVIDDVTDTEYSFVDSDDAVSRTNVSDAEYGDNLYVEMSSGHMLGSTVSSLAGERIASL